MLPVSVIIPVYITRVIQLDWLRECLESVKVQNCDCVIYDDGSKFPNEIRDIVNSYNTLFASDITNRGVSYARNVCAAIAETPYIFPLDCDDTLAEGAIQQLYSAWDGVPIYPDISKFGTENVPHWQVLDFDCEHVKTLVGFTSVNVLHSVKQWSAIGGWNPNIDFYEDGEYNARLFGRFCGKRFPKPLVNYRQHNLQRVVQYNARSHEYADKILKQIRSMDMACPGCGKRRSSNNQDVGRRGSMFSSTPAPRANVTVGGGAVDLPLEMNGKVLVQYSGGKGMAKHYKRGPSTNIPYAVKYHDFLYVDPADAVDSLSQGHPFLKVTRAGVKPVEIERPAEKVIADEPVKTEEPVVAREPKTNVVRTPVAAAEDLPDIFHMTLKALQRLDTLTPDMAVRLLTLEEGGKHRSQMITWLKHRIKND